MRAIRVLAALLPVCCLATFAWLTSVASIRAAGDVGETTEQRIARLIDQLGASDFHARQRAQQELLKIGVAAIDALNDASDHDDLEIAERARYLLKLVPIELVRETDPPSVKKILENYEAFEPEQRVAIMTALSKEPRGQGVEALCRLVRFEKSLGMSRQAALTVLAMPDPEPVAWPKRAKTMVDVLEGSQRTGARWLRTLAKAQTDPEGALIEWEKCIADEQAAIAQNGPAGEAFVSALLRRQAVALEKLMRHDEAVAAIRKLITYERGNPGTLAELIEWLAKHGSWELVNEVAQRFDRAIQQDVWLSYVLADVRLTQGQKEAAAELAEKAFNLPAERPLAQLPAHMQAAVKLQQRGRFEWAEREYKDLVQQPISRYEAAQARILYAEMLHDQDRDSEAASALAGFDSARQTGTVAQLLDRMDQSYDKVRARRQYFQALTLIKDQRNAGALDLLKKALNADSTHPDILIALYQGTAADPKERAIVAKQIRKAAETFRQLIEENGNNPFYYNQFAWLIANTEGDYEEALNCSLKSLELSPGAAGYLDTLSHCYFAKKDYANAVATQTRAVELDPHSGAMKRALERFQAAGEKK